MVETMKWERNRLVLLDQTKLPLQVAWIVCREYRRVVTAIKKLEVRGAPAIGAVSYTHLQKQSFNFYRKRISFT